MDKLKDTNNKFIIVTHDDEIDFFELLRDLWREKWLISLGVFLGMICAITYNSISHQRFESSVVLVPSSITVFAPVMKGMEVGMAAERDFLGVALKLTNNAIALLGRHILAPSLQADFISSDPRFSDCFIKAKQNINETSKSLSGVTKITVSLVCSSESASRIALKNYIDHASEVAAHEFKYLNSSLGIESSIQADDLYSIESEPITLITPKKRNIFAVGFLLGAICGIFMALMRSSSKKRIKPLS